ncbi:hypothetical protein BN1200_410060 [Klebsiella variicola]|nr:hypothetical protein KVR801_210056 [Klebsiella variicola]CTQ13425.1 hypothetical protein BN1200_410060 [Klebsiella variicola]
MGINKILLIGEKSPDNSFLLSQPNPHFHFRTKVNVLLGHNVSFRKLTQSSTIQQAFYKRQIPCQNQLLPQLRYYQSVVMVVYLKLYPILVGP